MDKKVQLNQFHVEADGAKSALNELSKKCNYKPLGIKLYPKQEELNFINLKFY
mgnify:FL=1